ncbi:MAG: peptide-methionine (S)-S-oxide reductase MsrA [Candidatus Eremiobacteraeota bacterium]|nr:peptide-methionine (S)-S-oxide reductase MsrA [Candidatus Eremiobacteraeota bacterium]
MLNIISVAVASLVLAVSSPTGSASPGTPTHQLQHIVLAGGCFWGMEAVFDDVKGVTSAVAGYAGGSKATAHYEIVSTGLTGHAESVQVTFDPSKVSLEQLLDVYFFVAHDPTELDRQGPDEGSQYRSAIFYMDDEQKRIALAYIKRLQNDKAFDKPVVTQVVPLPAFYPAEAYHQHYVADHPDSLYVQYNDLPKLAELHKRYPQLAKTT